MLFGIVDWLSVIDLSGEPLFDLFLLALSAFDTFIDEKPSASSGSYSLITSGFAGFLKLGWDCFNYEVSLVDLFNLLLSILNDGLLLGISVILYMF